MIVAYLTDNKTGQVARSSTMVAEVLDIFETTSEVMNDGGELWRVVSPLTSPLGTIMRCAKISCRLDNGRRPR
jgi:hypothetical protein